MGTTSGEGGGGGTQIPQPLVVKGGLSSYKSRDAVIADIAIKLFVNTNFDTSGKSPNQCAKDSIVRAQMFANAAGDLIDTLVADTE